MSDYRVGDRVTVITNGTQFAGSVISFDSHKGEWWLELDSDSYGYQYVKSADGATIRSFYEVEEQTALQVGQKVQFETRSVKGTGTIRFLPSPERVIILTCCAYEKHAGVMGNEFTGPLLGNHNLSIDVWNIREIA